MVSSYARPFNCFSKISIACRKWFTIVSIIVAPALFIINAPFGRFALNGKSILLLDGVCYKDLQCNSCLNTQQVESRG